MLEIRQETLRSFEDDHRSRWENQLVDHLIRACPESVLGLSEDELRLRIQECEAKANRYHILAANQVASFTQILFEEGFDFDERPPHPWVTEILSDPKRDEYAKVDHLWAYLDGYEKEDIEDVVLVDEELNSKANEELDDDEFDNIEVDKALDEELDDFDIDDI